MAYEDFPDEASLRFRTHVFYVYAQSILNLAAELAADGPENFTEEDLQLFDEFAAQSERIFIEAVKVKSMVRNN